MGEENPMENSVLKYDHFENIHRLPESIRKFEGAPNFRQVPGYRVFGTGQPTKEGFQKVLDYMVKEKYCKKLHWTNMRQEPVIYLNGQSFTPRNEDKMNENMEFPDASAKKIEWYQDAFKLAVKGRIGDDKKVSYFKDTYAEHPDDRENLKVEVELEKEEDLTTLSGLYDQLKELGFDLKYTRSPIMDEKSPSEKDFDNLVKSLVTGDSDTATIFNCQMGKGRTTTGMLIGCLMYDALHNHRKTFPICRRPHVRDDDEWKKENGWYRCVMEMMTLFDCEKDKSHLDNLLDLCGDESTGGQGLQNLRECIVWTQDKYLSEPEEKKDYWKRMGGNFIERYLYLICFTHYVRIQAFVGHHTCDVPRRFTKFTFKAWMGEIQGLREHIQKSMETFKWEVQH